MRQLTSTRQVVVMMSVLLALGSGFSARAAEVEVVYVKHARQTISETKANPGHPGTGELAQQIFLDSASEAPEDFPLIETVVYNQDDTVEGNGTHRGYEVSIFKNGDRAYSQYQGTHTLTIKEDGAWEVNYEGTQSYIGGTGMYTNLKGPGTYKGRVTPESFEEEGNWHVTY